MTTLERRTTLTGWFAVTLASVSVGFLLGMPVAVAQKNGSGQDTEIQQLKERVSQLEEQLVDMRVIVGTLESLARTPAASGGATTLPGYGSGAAGGGDESGKVAILETQIRALTAQVERLSDLVRGTRGQQRPQSGTWGTRSVQPQSSEGGDGIGAFIRRSQVPNSASGGVSPGQAVPGGAQAQYDAAYGAFLQNDLAQAQSGFRRLIQHFRHSNLAGDAFFWLGETYYRQKNYPDAAVAFQTVADRFGSSRFAADAVMKLALTRDQLGDAKAACARLAALAQVYPDAPRGIQRDAARLGQRLRCSGGN